MTGARPVFGRPSELAQDKAYTAAGFGLTTGEWRDMLASDSALAINVHRVHLPENGAR
jgi:uncharacterized protein GlcG (DUF336 family)